TPVACVLAYRRPSALAMAESRHDASSPTEVPFASATLPMALASPTFWTFSLSISLFGLVSSGVTLFQQMILGERGLSEGVFHRVLVLGLIAGMAMNLIGGWLCRRVSVAVLLSSGMPVLSATLVALPLLRSA